MKDSTDLSDNHVKQVSGGAETMRPKFPVNCPKMQIGNLELLGSAFDKVLMIYDSMIIAARTAAMSSVLSNEA